MQYLLRVVKRWYMLVATFVTQDGINEFTQSIPLDAQVYERCLCSTSPL